MPVAAVRPIARTITLRFRGISAPVAFEGTRDLLPVIDGVFPGWPRTQLTRRSPNPPVISFTKEGGKYRRHSRWAEVLNLDDDPADAMCDFVSDVLDAYIEEHPGMLGIHGSVVRMRDGLVVFPSTHRSGKSLLMTHLVHQGAVLFSDDVLLLPRRSGRGIATGIVPRLRLPVPKESSRRFHRFLRQTGMYANHRYGWVKFNLGQVAPLGEKAPVRAIVLLDRKMQNDKKTRMKVVPRADALSHLARRGFALDAKAGEVLARLAGLTENAECFKLEYGIGEEAAKVLISAFGKPVDSRQG